MIFGKMFNLIYFQSKALKKDQEKLFKDLENAKKIKKSLEEMSFDPLTRSLNIKKMKPKEDERFRLKVWAYRVIFSIDFWNNNIIIYRIWLRKDIYK